MLLKSRLHARRDLRRTVGAQQHIGRPLFHRERQTSTFITCSINRDRLVPVFEVIGVHVRRLAFAELLPAHAHVVKSALFHGATGWRRLAGSMMWPVSRHVMVRVFDIVPGAAEESRSKLEEEFDWLEEKLADGRTYLVGDRFSRADLTVASLLAQFARPNELGIHHTMSGSDFSPLS